MSQFVQVNMGLVRGDESLPGNALKVLAVITSYLPRAFPSIPTICKRANLCRNTVLKWKEYLEKKGILEIGRTFGKVNLYTVAKQYLREKLAQRVEANRTKALEQRIKHKHFRTSKKLVPVSPSNQYQKEVPNLEQIYLSKEESKFNALEILKMLQTKF